MRRDLFVSVVIPLVAEVDGIMRQSYGDYELILIADGSTDGTRSFFERAKTNLACFRYLSLTRPFGLEVASLADWSGRLATASWSSILHRIHHECEEGKVGCPQVAASSAAMRRGLLEF